MYSRNSYNLGVLDNGVTGGEKSDLSFDDENRIEMLCPNTISYGIEENEDISKAENDIDQINKIMIADLENSYKD